jgi:hypothetical protein
MRVTTGARKARKATKATSTKQKRQSKKKLQTHALKPLTLREKQRPIWLGKNGQSIKREKSQLEREASSIILLILL